MRRSIRGFRDIRTTDLSKATVTAFFFKPLFKTDCAWLEVDSLFDVLKLWKTVLWPLQTCTHTISHNGKNGLF